MVFGVSFIAFLTAGVTSMEALNDTNAHLTALDQRLDLIETKLSQ